MSALDDARAVLAMPLLTLGSARMYRDALAALVAECAEFGERVDRLETAIRTVLADEESGEGGWGPDITMVAVLRDALLSDDEDPLPGVRERKGAGG